MDLSSVLDGKALYLGVACCSASNLINVNYTSSIASQYVNTQNTYHTHHALPNPSENFNISTLVNLFSTGRVLVGYPDKGSPQRYLVLTQIDILTGMYLVYY